MATTKLQIIPDINGKPTYILPQSNVTYTGLLTANTPQSVTAPTDALAYGVVIGVSNGADILISINGTATIPTGSPTLSKTDVNRAKFYVNAGGTVSVISPQSDVIYSLGFYAVN